MKNRIYRIAIFVPHKGCPHDCIFCNQRRITGQTEEMTGIRARNIIEENLESIEKTGVENRYVEIAFFGGSFTAIDMEKQRELLSVAKEYIDSGKVDGIRCSTRPDAITEDILENAVNYSVSAIELGVQSADNNVLLKCERGHSFEDVKKAAELIKSKGISLGLQMMTGLYGDTDFGCVETAKKIAELKPDCVRIYPTLVMEGTALKDLYDRGLYTPQNLEEAVDLVARLIKIFEDNNIEILRIGLQTNEEVNYGTVSGPYHPAFAELCYGRIMRKTIEEFILKEECSNCILEIKSPKKSFSKIMGHKRENAIYFEKNYKIKLVLKESETDLIEINKKMVI